MCHTAFNQNILIKKKFSHSSSEKNLNVDYIKVRKMSILAFHFTFLDQNRLKMGFSNLNIPQKGPLKCRTWFLDWAYSAYTRMFLSIVNENVRKSFFFQRTIRIDSLLHSLVWSRNRNSIRNYNNSIM